MRVGIVGSGMISGHHLTAAARYPGCEVIGIADRDIARARAQAERFSVRRTFATLHELLNLKPDVVHVLTPPASHAELVCESLLAGANVYVEKPMALTEGDCETMTSAAVSANRQLCVGHNWLYNPAMVRAQELIASGAAGEIVQAAASFNYNVGRNPSLGPGHWSRELPGGLAEDLAVHPLSLLLRLLGAPRRTTAVTRSASQAAGGNTLDVRALLDAERGLGTLSVTLRGRPDVILLDIHCTRMLLRLNISSMAVTVYRELPVPQKIGRGITDLSLAAQLIGCTVGTAWKLLRRRVDGSYGIAPLIHAFYAALESGRPAPVGPHEGAQAVGVLRSIWPAAELPSRRVSAR